MSSNDELLEQLEVKQIKFMLVYIYICMFV